MFHKKSLHKMHEQARCCDEAAGCPQLQPLNHLKSFHGGMFKPNTKFDADSLLYLLILNAMATQYTCSFNSVYCSL